MDDRNLTRVARTLAEGDGNDPDALMTMAPPMKVAGRDGFYVPSREFCFPVWRAYLGMAREVIEGHLPVQQSLFEAAE